MTEEELSPGIWAATLAGSLLLHAGAAAALAPLLLAAGESRPATAITFSGPSAEEAPFQAVPVEAAKATDAAAAPPAPAASETAPRAAESAAARAAHAETLAPSTAAAPERLAALQPDTASARAPEVGAALQDAKSVPAAPAGEAGAEAVPAATVGPAAATELASLPSAPPAPGLAPASERAPALASEAPLPAAPLQGTVPASPPAAALPAAGPAVQVERISSPRPTIDLASTTDQAHSVAPEALPTPSAPHQAATPADTSVVTPPPALQAVEQISSSVPAAGLSPAAERAPPAGPSVAGLPPAARVVGRVSPSAAVPRLAPASERATSTAAAPVAAPAGRVGVRQAGRVSSPAQSGTPLPQAVASAGRAGSVPPVATLQPLTLPALPETQGAGGGESTVAMLVPQPEPPRPTAASRWRDAVAFARSFSRGSCFAVMPAVGAGGDVAFEAFSPSAAALRAFTEAADALGEKPAVALAGLSDAQCGALEFFRTAAGQSDFPLSIRLDTPRVRDHATVTGTIVRPDSRATWLVLVDDDGLAHPIGRLDEGDPEGWFEFPVNLTDGEVRTKQLLMAIAGAALPTDWDERPRPAAEFFSALERSGKGFDVAIAAFAVEPVAGD